jgi:hypothetical protein
MRHRVGAQLQHDRAQQAGVVHAQLVEVGKGKHGHNAGRRPRDHKLYGQELLGLKECVLADELALDVGRLRRGVDSDAARQHEEHKLHVALRLDKTGALLKLEALEPGLERNSGVICHGIWARVTRALQECSPMLIGLCIARLTKGHSKSESIAEELGDDAQ